MTKHMFSWLVPKVRGSCNHNIYRILLSVMCIVCGAVTGCIVLPLHCVAIACNDVLYSMKRYINIIVSYFGSHWNYSSYNPCVSVKSQ